MNSDKENCFSIKRKSFYFLPYYLFNYSLLFSLLEVSLIIFTSRVGWHEWRSNTYAESNINNGDDTERRGKGSVPEMKKKTAVCMQCFSHLHTFIFVTVEIFRRI